MSTPFDRSHSVHIQKNLLVSIEDEPTHAGDPAFEIHLRGLQRADIEAALAVMCADVEWPRAFKGGFVQGPEAIRAYWTEQWSEIDPRVEPLSFHQESATSVLVEVHQVVRDLTGAVLADVTVGHRFTFANSLIARMEVADLPRPPTP